MRRRCLGALLLDVMCIGRCMYVYISFYFLPQKPGGGHVHILLVVCTFCTRWRGVHLLYMYIYIYIYINIYFYIYIYISTHRYVLIYIQNIHVYTYICIYIYIYISLCVFCPNTRLRSCPQVSFCEFVVVARMCVCGANVSLFWCVKCSIVGTRRQDAHADACTGSRIVRVLNACASVFVRRCA